MVMRLPLISRISKTITMASSVTSMLSYYTYHRCLRISISSKSVIIHNINTYSTRVSLKWWAIKKTSTWCPSLVRQCLKLIISHPQWKTTTAQLAVKTRALSRTSSTHRILQLRRSFRGKISRFQTGEIVLLTSGQPHPAH